MLTTDEQYANLIRACMEGPAVTTRNALCHRTICYPVRFTSTPLVCARKTAWRTCLREWEWFMSGSNRIADLHESVRPWWQPWADKCGYVPYNYSRQFRFQAGNDDGNYFDQIGYLIDSVRDHPNSRRAVITTWNTSDMTRPDCPITNCHSSLVQAFVEPDGNTLHLKTYQRSADVICGVPHNWLQSWAFLMWLAHLTGRQVGSLMWEGGDCHVYDAHWSVANRVLGVSNFAPAPELIYTPTSDDFRAGDFTLSCEYLPTLTDRAEMIV